MGFSPPPGDPGLFQSPTKSYSQVAAQSSRDLEEKFSNVVRYFPVADLKGGVASVGVPEELLSDSKPLWSAYIVGHFMGNAPHIGKVHAIVNRIWSFPDKPAKIDAQFISPRTVLFCIDNPQLKERVLKRIFWHIADIPIVVREWSPATASAQPDLTAVPLWVDLQGLHSNTERCIRLDVARLLVVMNLEEPLPASIKVRGSGKTISVSYPWLPPRCLDCQKWGHTDKTCSKKKRIKDKEEVSKEKEQAGSVVANEVSKYIDIGNPVLEVAHVATVEASAQKSSTKDSEREVEKEIEIHDNEKPCTSSPSRFHLLSTELEEGEVEAEDESSSSEEESSMESKVVLEKRKQMEKQKLGKNKKNQKSNPNVNVGNKKDQTKGAKNKQTNHVSSRRH
ncbi:hypothetical protein Bca52824_042125 [Brassica carinata]|uniref:DUF4283 domain-containing protein n=1 Tax=Brassica carinata TaxID=52824 RepID=A0A8X7UZF6_BRACI|nr:hypothetical protein Bca52824_042125 [Brassica carinata]